MDNKCQLCDVEDDHARDCPIRIATELAMGRPVDFTSRVDIQLTRSERARGWRATIFGA